MATVSKLTSAGDHFVSGQYDEYNLQYNSYGVQFNGSTQYLTATNSQTPGLTSENFTIECWFNLSGLTFAYPGGSYGATILNAANLAVNGGVWVYIAGSLNTPTSIALTSSGSTVGPQAIASGLSISLNAWHHLAISRNGSNLAIWLDGTKLTLSLNNIATSSYVALPFSIGRCTHSTAYAMYTNGSISNLRLVKGTPVYDPTGGNITVPRSPLTAVSGTYLLTCQNQTIVDNSPNAFSISNPASATTGLSIPSWMTTKSKQYSNGDLNISGTFDEYTNYQDYLRYYSVLLNGTNQYINTGIGTTTSTVFTVECHLYLTSWLRTTGAGGYIGVIYGGNAGNAPWFVLSGTASSITSIFHAAVGTAAADKSWSISGGLQLNTWYHIAISRNGSTWAVWINGVKLSNPGDTGPSYVFASGTMTIGVNLNNAGYAGYIPGYISNFKVVSGSTTYDPTSTTITVPTTPYRNPLTTYYLYQCAASTVSGGVNGPTASTFIPFSPKSLGQSSNGSVATTGKFDEYTLTNGVYSSSFNGSSQYLSLASNAALTFSTGNFTIEFWIYVTAAPVSSALIYDPRPASTQGLYTLLYLNSDRTMRFWVSSADRITSTALTLNTWYHIALVKNSNVTTMYLNGTATGSTYSDTNSYLASATNIAAGYAAGASITSFFTGYLSNLRVVKGTAVYTSNFTPVKEPLLPTPNTSLLTCQLPRIEDNSTNVLPITNNGATTSYFLTKFYSGIFNSNRYLSATGNAGFNFGSGNFTIEFMAMRTSASTQNMIATNRSLAASTFTGSWWIDNSINNQIRVTFFTGGSYSISNPNALDWPAVGIWFHFAVVRNGTTLTGYLNGTAVGSVAVGTTTFGTGADNIRIGGGFTDTAAWYWPGYISNFRVIKGLALYTSDFTPSVLKLPTSNLTAISGSGYSTSLLTLNSATIVDNSGNSIGISNVGASSVSAPIFI
jgi:Concanavalin A-like lectin/glucanases superfamily